MRRDRCLGRLEQALAVDAGALDLASLGLGYEDQLPDLPELPETPDAGAADDEAS